MGTVVFLTPLFIVGSSGAPRAWLTAETLPAEGLIKRHGEFTDLLPKVESHWILSM